MGKRTEAGAYCNKQEFEEFGIWASELKLRRKAKVGDIFVMVKTEVVTDYHIVREEDLKKINGND